MSEVTEADAVKRGDDVTEIVTAHFDRVDGVGSPANGTPWLLLKAKDSKPADMDADGDTDADDAKTADAFERNAGGEMSDKAKAAFARNAKKDADVTIDADEVDVESADDSDDDDVEKSDSAEADEIEREMTGAAKATAYCGDPECAECVKAELVPLKVATTIASGVTKAQLKAADRKKMPKSSFAYVDAKGEKHLPVHDEAHVRAALSRFGQQDFSNPPNGTTAADAKAAAARKIKTAAGEHGIKLDDDSDVGQAAKGAVQDALGGTKAPEAAGVIDGSQSGVAGPATAGAKDAPTTVPDDRHASGTPGVVAQLRGGESAYTVPAEQRLGMTNPGPTSGQTALGKQEMAVAALVGTMTKLEEHRRAQKDGGYMSILGPTADQSAQPGSMPWESYDSATLDQVAQALASCCNALDCLSTREQIEAVAGDSGDMQDSWDLDCAADALECAMGIVARLAYAEGAEAQKSTTDSVVEKAYRRLRASDEKALRDAHAAITNVLAEHDRAESAAADAGQKEPSEGDTIQMELTKEELAEAITQASTAAVTKALEERDKADRKAAKQAKKAAKQEARKNANNGGDITVQQMQDGVNGEHDADDVQAAGAATRPEFVNKSEESDEVAKAMAEQLEAVTKSVESLGEQFQKFAKRPRTGGPVLDGQPRGVFPAAEQRMQDLSKGSDADDTGQLIKSLEEKYEQTSDALAKQDLGYRLTQLRLKQAHEQGRI